MFAARSGEPIAAPLLIVGIRPLPKPNSFIFSKSSFESEIAVGSSNNKSGRLERTRCIREVALANGGVNTSFTTNSRLFSANALPSTIGPTKATEAAVLSITMPMVSGLFPEADSARSSSNGKAFSLWYAPVAEV